MYLCLEFVCSCQMHVIVVALNGELSLLLNKLFYSVALMVTLDQSLDNLEIKCQMLYVAQSILSNIGYHIIEALYILLSSSVVFEN